MTTIAPSNPAALATGPTSAETQSKCCASKDCLAETQAESTDVHVEVAETEKANPESGLGMNIPIRRKPFQSTRQLKMKAMQQTLAQAQENMRKSFGLPETKGFDDLESHDSTYDPRQDDDQEEVDDDAEFEKHTVSSNPARSNSRKSPKDRQRRNSPNHHPGMNRQNFRMDEYIPAVTIHIQKQMKTMAQEFLRDAKDEPELEYASRPGGSLESWVEDITLTLGAFVGEEVSRLVQAGIVRDNQNMNQNMNHQSGGGCNGDPNCPHARARRMQQQQQQQQQMYGGNQGMQQQQMYGGIQQNRMNGMQPHMNQGMNGMQQANQQGHGHHHGAGGCNGDPNCPHARARQMQQHGHAQQGHGQGQMPYEQSMQSQGGYRNNFQRQPMNHYDQRMRPQQQQRQQNSMRYMRGNPHQNYQQGPMMNRQMQGYQYQQPQYNQYYGGQY